MSDQDFHPPSLEKLHELLPSFEFETVLASSSHDAVFLALQKSLNRKVAIRIHSKEASRDPDLVARIEATTRAMARLRHPNIIGVYDSGVADGMIYQVLEFVPGKSLERSLGSKPIDPAQTVSIISAVGDALIHAHEQGVSHGNLNASDILLNREAMPKIGKMHRGASEVEIAADIRGLGALLYRMLTGKPPSDGCPPPSKLVGCSQTFDRVWARASVLPGHEPFPSVRDMLAELDVKSAPVVAFVPPPTQPLPASTGRAVTGAATRKSAGFNWRFIFNLFLIAGLIVAIRWVWQIQKQRQTEFEQQRTAAETQAKFEREKTLREVREREERRNRINRPTDPVPPEPQVEDAAQSLERLRESLASGSRDEMPVGAVVRGGSAYLLVDRELSWPEACWFAERHGAHLVIPDETTNLEILTRKIAEGSPFWLGAGRSGKSEWRLVDGKSWSPSKEPAGLGAYVGADKFGILRAAGDQVRLPVLLQWRMDGSNPASLQQQLALTAGSIQAGSPSYPAGSQIIGDRTFLVVARKTDWPGAEQLAASSGGHLIVPGEIAEKVALKELAEHLSEGQRFWVGGVARNQAWSWITGEPWKESSPPPIPAAGEAALCVAAGSGWLAADPKSQLDGFFIEWSKDATQVGTSAAPPVHSGSPTAALEARVRELLATAQKEREKAVAGNPSSMVDANQKFAAAAAKLRDAYTAKLVDLVSAALKADQRKEAVELQKKITAAKDLAGWLESMGFSLEMKNPAAGN